MLQAKERKMVPMEGHRASSSWRWVQTEVFPSSRQETPRLRRPAATHTDLKLMTTMKLDLQILQKVLTEDEDIDRVKREMEE